MKSQNQLEHHPPSHKAYVIRKTIDIDEQMREKIMKKTEYNMFSFPAALLYLKLSLFSKTPTWITGSLSPGTLQAEWNSPISRCPLTHWATLSMSMPVQKSLNPTLPMATWPFTLGIPGTGSIRITACTYPDSCPGLSSVDRTRLRLHRD